MTQLITDRTLPRPRTAEKPITNKSLHQYCSSSTRGSSSSRRHSSVLIHHMITLTQLSLTRDNSTRQTLYIAHNVIPVCDSSTPATSHQAHLMHAHTHTHTPSSQPFSTPSDCCLGSTASVTIQHFMNISKNLMFNI